MAGPPDFEQLTAAMPEAERPVGQAIATRRSVRGFKPDPVPRATVEAILRLAARAPSGSNIQPWRVHVCAGAMRDDIVATVLDALSREPEAHAPQYQYYPRTWRPPYIDRRRATGWGLYGTLGIAKGDREATAAQHAKNYTFFGAPVGLFFTIEPDLELGSWLDYGMFLQSIMVAARGFGLDTCSQQAWSRFHRVVLPKLGVPEDHILVTGMALGWIDPAEPANAFWTEREPLDAFAAFHGFDDR